MRVTIEELAMQLKLNKGSVSRILNGKGHGYSAGTRHRVLERAAAMGYRPNQAARALATGATQMVALWLLTLESYSPYLGYVHHCLNKAAVKHGYQLITEDVRFPTEDQPECAQPMHWSVDAILAVDVPSLAAGYKASMQTGRPPVITLGEYYDSHGDYVSVDLYAGACEAVTHLLTAGCQRIAFVSEVSLGVRTDAYARLMEENGRATEYIKVIADTRTDGYQALRRYVKTHGCPDGLVCLNDEVAIGCYLALGELGIRVPEDVLLVGFDGLENARLFPCPISSVVIPIEEMCMLAWDFLLTRLQAPETPLQQRMLAPYLEVRASSSRQERPLTRH